MTPSELIQYKKDYHSRLAELKKEFQINQLMKLEIEKKQSAIMDKVFQAIDEHEIKCNEFDNEK